jgi:fatty-acyl-CoA synthase
MNLSRIIGRWATDTPARCAIHFHGEDITYAALWQRIDGATVVLREQFGVQPGERIAYLGLNHPDFIVFLMALARLGAIVVPLNFRLAPAELTTILTQCGARMLFCDEAMRAPGAEAAAGAGVALHSSSSLTKMPEIVVPHVFLGSEHLVFAGNDASPVLIVYTSGTTGKPKGAVHTQANLLWNIESAIDAQEITANDHLLNPLPMFHVGGLCIQMLPVLAAGGTVTLHARFDPGAWIADVAARRPTISLLVPATLKAILEHPDWPGADLSSLRLINTGSSVIPRSMIDAVHARGIPVSQVYGATETGPVSIVLRAEDARAKAGSAGKPALHVEVRLMKADGSACARGETGELWIRGKNVVAGYWHQDGSIDTSAFADSWFRSGDLAYQDGDGFYWVAGRSKDMIISGGENIYPAEIENILADCAAIAESAVIGQDDAKWGEVAVAVIVKKPDALLDEAMVKVLFEGRLARYKHPRRVLFVENLPKTALGKVKKDELRASLGMTRT